MNSYREDARLQSLGDELAGVLFLPDSNGRSPVLIICHGAGEFKENYFELCELLASRGMATLAIDMHGHGQSAGERYYVSMTQWVADVQAAIDFLLTHPKVDGNKIGAFGLSSGGTAILEAAMVDPRLKALVALDATVRDSLPLSMSLFMRLLVGMGKVKKFFTNKDLRLPLAKMSGGFHLASDPELDKRLQTDPRALAALNSWPFPGAAQAFFVNTLKRVSKIGIPTLVLWGEDDQLDPPETARLLFAALTCKKQLHIIPGNGHVGHLDRHKDKVFSLTAQWTLENLA
jgi:pimeloyl-ACP methyl ester carboxylesterase